MQSELLKEIERDAAHGKPAPKDLEPPEIMLYYMLMGLYASYQSGKITKEQGHGYKDQIMATYKRLSAEYKQFTEVCTLYQSRIREGYSVGGITVIPKEA
ncbi:hypothetical protein [Ruminococcus sp.]|uniref:hypothetical protein n=1 Tax=Ruminococcus sp. TaxID=41978 RepID=UPI0025F401F3|nr:hypothetical protein [Ruminococcus sp.]